MLFAMAAMPSVAYANPIVSPVLPWPIEDDRWLLAWGAAVGLIEAPIVHHLGKARWVRCVSLMLLANLLSSLFGWVWPLRGLLHTLHFKVWDAAGYWMSVNTAAILSLLVVCWTVAILVEIPFVYVALERQPRRLRRAIVCSIVAQTVSYALIAPLAWWIVGE